MKRKEKQNLWQKSIAELEKMLAERKLNYAKIALNMNETKDKNLPRKIEKEIAIIKTILAEVKFKETLKKNKGVAK